jgi:murein DD-endopeptidase MepM/ murein hydrolase activator NlpD
MIFNERMMNHLPFGYVNLDLWSQEWLVRHELSNSESNPLLDPTVADRMVRDFHAAHGLSWSYGGWLEDRRTMHRGTYLEADEKWTHIGLDVNAPAGTPIRALADGPVIYVGTDSPLTGGWGGHIIQKIGFQGSSHLLVYAHLGYINARCGEHLKKGDGIADIGTPAENGYWFPHVHLQLFGNPKDVHGAHDWEMFSKGADGYTTIEYRSADARNCPDPTPLIFGFGG